MTGHLFKDYQRRGLALIMAIIAFLLVVSWICVSLNLDLIVAARFYSTDAKWVLKERQPWRFLYEYGTIPGVVLGIGALIGWFFCLTGGPARQRLRRRMLLVVLTIVIGAGLLVNAVLKPYWGRPRPSQILQFGGMYDYRPVYSPGTPGKGESFPCGHCTMGFVFVSLICFRKYSRALAYTGTAFGVVLGVLLSIARIGQGAHFLTDTVWSMGIISLTAALMHYFVLRIPDETNASAVHMTMRKKVVIGFLVFIGILSITGFFLTRRPFFDSFYNHFNLSRDTESVKIRLNITPEKASISFKAIPHAKIILHSQGFGWPSAMRNVSILKRQKAETLLIDCEITPAGYFAELNHRIELWLPLEFENRLSIEFISPRPELEITRHLSAPLSHAFDGNVSKN